MVKSLYIAIFAIFYLHAATEIIPLDHRAVKNFRVMNAQLIKQTKGESQWDAVGIFQLCQDELHGVNTGAICPQPDRIAFFGSLGIAVGLGIGFDQGVLSVPMTSAEAGVFKGMAYNLGRNLRPDSQFDVTNCADPTKAYEQQHLRGFTSEVNKGVADTSVVARAYTVDLFGVNEVKNDHLEKEGLAREYANLSTLSDFDNGEYIKWLRTVRNSNKNYFQYDSPLLRKIFVRVLQNDRFVNELIPGYSSFMEYCAQGLLAPDIRHGIQLAFRESFIEAIRIYPIQFSLPVIEDVIMDEKFKCVERKVGVEISMSLLGSFLKTSIEAIQSNPARQKQIIKFLKLFVKNIVVTQQRRIGLFDLEQLDEQLLALLETPEAPDPVAVRTAEYFDYNEDEGQVKPVVFAINQSFNSIQRDFDNLINSVKYAICYPGTRPASLNGTALLEHFQSISKLNLGNVVSALRKSRLDRTKVFPFFKNYQARCIALLTPYFERLDRLIAYLKTAPTSTVESSMAEDVQVWVGWHSPPGVFREGQHQALRDVLQLQSDVEK